MTMIRRLFPLALIALAAPSALAASSTGTLTVQATVTNSCTIGNATLAFASYTQAAGGAASSTIGVNCSLLTPYTLSMDNGQNYDSVASKRRMKATVSSTDYFIPYTTSITGALSVLGVATPLVGTGVNVPLPVVGTADAGANVPAATYTDSVTVSVNF